LNRTKGWRNELGDMYEIGLDIVIELRHDALCTDMKRRFMGGQDGLEAIPKLEAAQRSFMLIFLGIGVGRRVLDLYHYSRKRSLSSAYVAVVT